MINNNGIIMFKYFKKLYKSRNKDSCKYKIKIISNLEIK